MERFRVNFPTFFLQGCDPDHGRWPTSMGHVGVDLGMAANLIPSAASWVTWYTDSPDIHKGWHCPEWRLAFSLPRRPEPWRSSSLPKHFQRWEENLSRGLDYELQDCALQLSDDGALTYNFAVWSRDFPRFCTYLIILYLQWWESDNVCPCRKTLDRRPSGLETESLFTSDAVAISECITFKVGFIWCKI